MGEVSASDQVFGSIPLKNSRSSPMTYCDGQVSQLGDIVSLGGKLGTKEIVNCANEAASDG